MMYDELIKRLRASCESCKLWDGYKCCLKGECSAQKSLQAADAIEKLIEVIQNHGFLESLIKPDWTPVTERLPNVWEIVITFDKDEGVRENWISGDGTSWSRGYHITHWVPLPQPPKEET